MARLDRTALTVHKQLEEPSVYVYWMAKSDIERISAIDYLRKQQAGTQSGSADASVQRVYRISKRT